MTLRPRRQNLVVWSQSRRSARSARRNNGARATRPGRAARIRRRVQITVLLTIVGLLPLARGARDRWRPLLAGTALTVAGFIMRDSATGSVLMLPGLLILATVPLLPGRPRPEHRGGSKLERELAGYMTNAQRFELGAALDRYPDDVTREVREILSGPTGPRYEHRVPGPGPYWNRGL